MSTVLTIGLLAALLLLNVAVDPSPRNFRTLKIGAVGGLASVVVTWLWPFHVMHVLLGIALLPALWFAVRFALWPAVVLFRALERD